MKSISKWCIYFEIVNVYCKLLKLNVTTLELDKAYDEFVSTCSFSHVLDVGMFYFRKEEATILILYPF